MSVSRRDVLKRSLLAGGALAVPQIGLGQVVTSPRLRPMRYRPFTRNLAIPPVRTPESTTGGVDTYTIDTDDDNTHEFFPGVDTPVLAYEATVGGSGIVPGPTIKATRNREVRITFRNRLTAGAGRDISVHLHGAHVAPEHDGHPTSLIPPGFGSGNEHEFVYPNSQLPTTLWYHDHAVDVTGDQVYRGMAGIYILRPESGNPERALLLPGNDLHPTVALQDDPQYDVPLLIQDKLFNSDGTLYYALTSNSLRNGVLGTHMLVNGIIQPKFDVKRRRYRFRIVNGSNARIYDLALSTGQPFIQIGTDGGLLSTATNRSIIRLAPAERVDVVIDFSGRTQGERIYLLNRNGVHRDFAPRALMRFDVGATAADPSVVINGTPLIAIAAHNEAARDGEVSLDLLRGPDSDPAGLLWTLAPTGSTGQIFDPANNSPMVTMTDGDLVRWTFLNKTAVAHPMHIHLVQFQILRVNGVAQDVGTTGWKDTVLVPPNGTGPASGPGQVDLIGQFTLPSSVGSNSKYVFHCHILEHEDHAMMAECEVQT